jgi:ATP-dependent Clp protease ATP-binding subunit ClpA
MLNNELVKSLDNAFVFASDNQHVFVDVEHMLLVLLDNLDVTKLLDLCSAKVLYFKTHLLEFLAQAEMRSKNEQLVCSTSAYENVIQNAILCAKASGKKEITGVDLLMVLLRMDATYSARLLNEGGVELIAGAISISQDDAKKLEEVELERIWGRPKVCEIEQSAHH